MALNGLTDFALHGIQLHGANNAILLQGQDREIPHQTGGVDLTQRVRPHTGTTPTQDEGGTLNMDTESRFKPFTFKD